MLCVPERPLPGPRFFGGLVYVAGPLVSDPAVASAMKTAAVQRCCVGCWAVTRGR